MLWRTPRLIGRAFTSETAQDWMTNTMFTASPDAGVNKDQGFVSCRTSFDSPRQSIQGAFSIVDASNRRSTETPIRSMERPMVPNGEARPHGLTGVLMNSNDQEREAMPHRSEYVNASEYSTGRDRGEKGLTADAVDHKQDPTLNFETEQETPEPLMTNGQSSTGSMILPLRTLKTKSGVSDLANARDRAANRGQMDFGEPVSQPGVNDTSTLSRAPAIPQFTFSQAREEVESSSERRVSRFADDASPWKSAPLYFHQQIVHSGDGQANVTDIAPEQPFGDELTAWFRLDGQSLKGGNTETNVSIMAERTTQQAIPGMQKDGLPVVNATDTFQASSDVASRKSPREYPTAEMDEATGTSSPTLQEAAETPAPTTSVSDLKERAPVTKDVANTKNCTSPRKISFLDKIRGEMKVLSGKLGNNQDKIMEGKKMMGKVV